MSISIHIEAHPDRGDMAKQIEQSMSALGFSRTAFVQHFYMTDKGSAAELTVTSPVNTEDQAAVDVYQQAAAVLGLSTRERGKPGEGRARRTKAEIAEDEAADKADAERAAAAREAGIQTDAADDVRPAISTGDERIGPEDSEEVVAQDAADEAAEAAANKTGLTHDDLRQAVGRYQKKFGMAAAVAGVPALLGCAIVEVPEADLEKAIAKIDNAVAGDAPGPVDDAVPATKADLIAAMKRYALKFDGQDTNMDAMPHTMADCPTIFGMLFGPDAKSVSTVPVDGYAKAIAGIEEAIAKDPFKRGVK